VKVESKRAYPLQVTGKGQHKKMHRVFERNFVKIKIFE